MSFKCKWDSILSQLTGLARHDLKSAVHHSIHLALRVTHIIKFAYFGGFKNIFFCYLITRRTILMGFLSLIMIISIYLISFFSLNNSGFFIVTNLHIFEKVFIEILIRQRKLACALYDIEI